jgi:hypothetical protein
MKVIPQNLIDLGFTPAMFRFPNEADLVDLITAVITEQAALLEGRLGSSIYDIVTTPETTFVKRAERCLVAAELMSRRVTIITESVLASGEERSTKAEVAQMKRYDTEAEAMIKRLIAGVTSDSSDFASGVTTSTHFAADTDLSGEEA